MKKKEKEEKPIKRPITRSRTFYQNENEMLLINSKHPPPSPSLPFILHLPSSMPIISVCPTSPCQMLPARQPASPSLSLSIIYHTSQLNHSIDPTWSFPSMQSPIGAWFFRDLHTPAVLLLTSTSDPVGTSL